VSQISINAGAFSRQYKLNYVVPASADYNKRVFLTEVYYTVPLTDALFDTLRYTIDYNDMAGLPPRLSDSQDHYGYYNGKNNINLLPMHAEFPTSSWDNADRNPDFFYAVRGSLSKITFPTGGFEAIEYEANSSASYVQANTTTTKTVTTSGNTNAQGQWVSVMQYSQTFTSLQNQAANLFFNTYANPGCSGNCNPESGVTLSRITVRNLTTGGDVLTRTSETYAGFNFAVSLESNNTYRLELTVWGLPNAATAEIRYDYSSGPTFVWENRPGYGLRVKSIETFDPVSNKSSKRYYTYAEMTSPLISSGIMIHQVNTFPIQLVSY